jgi:hypothetical protein
VKLAWLLLRYRPDSALVRWFIARVGAVRGRTRKFTAVALARKTGRSREKRQSSPSRFIAATAAG